MLLPNAVAGATGESVDLNIHDTLNHRDTIIPSLNGASSKLDVGGVTDMDAIGVRAVSRCQQLHSSHSDVCRVCDENVEPFGVH